MTINQAIKFLIELREKHGDIPVFFDCENCRQSFSPDFVAPIATHFKAASPPPSAGGPT